MNSETSLGIVNVSVTNLLGNGHYFVDKSGCSEKLKANLICYNVDPLSPTCAFEVSLTFAFLSIQYTQIDSALKFG